MSDQGCNAVFHAGVTPFLFIFEIWVMDLVSGEEGTSLTQTCWDSVSVYLERLVVVYVLCMHFEQTPKC